MYKKKVFRYVGPVMSFGNTIEDKWEGTTTAISKNKAISNLAYRYKKINGYEVNTKIELLPECLKICKFELNTVETNDNSNVNSYYIQNQFGMIVVTNDNRELSNDERDDGYLDCFNYEIHPSDNVEYDTLYGSVPLMHMFTDYRSNVIFGMILKDSGLKLIDSKEVLDE